jgi:hypothetical protein
LLAELLSGFLRARIFLQILPKVLVSHRVHLLLPLKEIFLDHSPILSDVGFSVKETVCELAVVVFVFSHF